MYFSTICLSVLLAGLAGAVNPGDYEIKSVYIIDGNGHISESLPYERFRRDAPNFLRVRRGGGYASSSSHASASSSSSSSSNSGGGGYLGGDYNPGIIDPGFNPGFFGGGTGGNKGGAQSFASSSSSSSSGSGQGGGGGGGEGLGGSAGYKGPILFSRFGEDVGSGIHVSGSAQGQRGAFSSSSSSIDGDGKIKYSVQSGKY